MNFLFSEDFNRDKRIQSITNDREASRITTRSFRVVSRRNATRVSESLRNFTIDFHPAIVASDFDIKRGDNRSHRCFHALKEIAVEGQRFPRCERSFPDAVKRARANAKPIYDRVPSIESESRGYVTTGLVVIGAKSMGI